MTKDDWKRDWEETKDILYNFVACRKYDNEMQDVVETYKSDMCNWFEHGNSNMENPMEHATQEQWYSLYLEKKRLERHRLSVQYAAYQHIPTNGHETPQTICTYHNDGKYLVCNVSQMTWINRNYLRDGNVICNDRQSQDITYYVMRSQNVDGYYICPNCGAEQPLEKLLDGCDYCHTKFDISAYRDKVTAVSKNKNTYESRETNAFVIGFLFVTVFGMIALMSSFMLNLTCAGELWWACVLSILVAVGGFCGIMISNRKTLHNTKMKRRLEDYNPNFSKEDFLASLDCKIKSIHFAEHPKELAAFVKCDIAPYIQNYQNIVGCETGKFTMKNFRVDGEYQYIDVNRQVQVIQDCGNHFRSADGIISMTLAKKLSHKLKNDVTMYRCAGCGASVSLVEGGKCQYCGKEMDYASYDWIITNYKHVKEL